MSFVPLDDNSEEPVKKAVDTITSWHSIIGGYLTAALGFILLGLLGWFVPLKEWGDPFLIVLLLLGLVMFIGGLMTVRSAKKRPKKYHVILYILVSIILYGLIGLLLATVGWVFNN